MKYKDPIEQLIIIANNEVGYLEKRTNAMLDDKLANAGMNNYTKYWRDLMPSFQGQPWCDCFVSWVFKATFGEELASKLLCGGLGSFYTPTSANYFARQGRLDTAPKVGDQIFFTKTGTSAGCYHTGIVIRVENNLVYTIEGNTSGANGVVDNGGGVAKKSYSLSNYGGKLLFGHPDFSLATEKDEIKKPKKFVKNTKYKLVKDLAVHNAPSGRNSMLYKYMELTPGLRDKDKNKDAKLDKGSIITCYKSTILDNGNIWLKIAPNAEYWILAYKKDGNIINVIDK